MNTLRKAMEWLTCFAVLNLMLGYLLFKKFEKFNECCPLSKAARMSSYLVLRSSHACLRIGRQFFSMHLCRLLSGLCFPNSYYTTEILFEGSSPSDFCSSSFSFP